MRSKKSGPATSEALRPLFDRRVDRRHHHRMRRHRRHPYASFRRQSTIGKQRVLCASRDVRLLQQLRDLSQRRLLLRLLAARIDATETDLDKRCKCGQTEQPTCLPMTI